MKRKGAQKKRNVRRSAPPTKTGPAVAASTAPKTLESGEILITNAQRTQLFAQVDLHSQSNFFCGYSDDLSDGGLFVATYEPLSPGQPVHVKCRLPDGEQLAADGRVAWLRDPVHTEADLAPGVGVVFDALDEAARRAALQFMTRREPTFIDPD